METMTNKIEIKPEEKYLLQMPYSNICVSLRIAGKKMFARLVSSEYPIVQLYWIDGSPFCPPIVPSAAGIYRDRNTGAFYSFVDL